MLLIVLGLYVGSGLGLSIPDDYLAHRDDYCPFTESVKTDVLPAPVSKMSWLVVTCSAEDALLRFYVEFWLRSVVEVGDKDNTLRMLDQLLLALLTCKVLELTLLRAFSVIHATFFWFVDKLEAKLPRWLIFHRLACVADAFNIVDLVEAIPPRTLPHDAAYEQSMRYRFNFHFRMLIVYDRRVRQQLPNLMHGSLAALGLLRAVHINFGMRTMALLVVALLFTISMSWAWRSRVRVGRFGLLLVLSAVLAQEAKVLYSEHQKRFSQTFPQIASRSTLFYSLSQ